jgi:methyl-accepting chemotaxis protein
VLISPFRKLGSSCCEQICLFNPKGNRQNITEELSGSIGEIGRQVAKSAGMAWAVVASEVKQLANQTARATDEISGQIDTVQAATSGAVDAIRHIGHTIVGIDEIAATIAASETGNAAVHVLSASDDLTRQSDRLGREVETLISTIRTV